MLTLLAVLAPAPRASASAPGGFLARPEGLAFGAAATLHHPSLPDATLGRVAPQTLPCNPVDGHVYERRAATVELDPPDAPGLVASATVVDKGRVDFDRAADRADVLESSKVERLSLLGGAVTARAVVANARTALDPGGWQRDGTVQLVDLHINGEAIAPTVPPGTVVDLPGVGYVALNEQRRTGNGTTSAGIEVTALRLHLDGGEGGYAGDVLVAHASARLSTGPSGAGGRIGGHAYVLAASARPVLTVHAQGTIGMPCAGTGGRVVERVVAGVEHAPVLSSQAGRTTVEGTIGETLVESETTATVEDLVALDGQVRAESVGVSATSRGTSTGVTSTGRASFVGLVIGGEPVQGDVPPNTEVRLRDVGVVQLNRQACESDGVDPLSCDGTDASAITVTGIRIVVRVADNPFELPVGATITVAVARAEAVA